MEDNEYRGRVDCYAYNGFSSKYPCKFLNNLYCANTTECAFFKTPEQYKEDVKKYGMPK